MIYIRSFTMKKITTIALLSALSTATFAADLNTDDKKITYAIGTQLGETLKQNLSPIVKVDEAILLEAIGDVLNGKKSQLTPEVMNEAMQTFTQRAAEQAQKANEKAQKAMQEAIVKNTAESDKLLAANKAKEGVTTTESGLQYRVIKAGSGKKPTATDTVKVHYKGTLADGTVFDSSYQRGEPVEFPLNGVIKGWTEGVQLMPIGSKYEFLIPAELAYGNNAPASIGPAKALTFEVELLDITTDKK